MKLFKSMQLVFFANESMRSLTASHKVRLDIDNVRSVGDRFFNNRCKKKILDSSGGGGGSDSRARHYECYPQE